MAPQALYNNAVAIGEKKAAASVDSILKLSILSGAHIAFGGLLAVTVGANMGGMASTNPGMQKFLFGLIGLPFGLFMVLVAGGELFTGNVAMVTAAFIEKRATLKGLAKSWSVSYIGNLIGSLLVCQLVHSAGMVSVPSIAADIAVSKVSKTFLQSLLKGVVCNWMVCMAVWVATGCSTLTEKFLAMALPVSAFVAFGAEHSIANMCLLPLGKLAGGDVTWLEIARSNLLPVTLGNIIGGALCQAGGYGAVYGSLLKRKQAVSKHHVRR